MTRIERIQPSLHKKDRVLVYLTGGRLLRITPEELLRFDLRPGMDLAEDVLEELSCKSDLIHLAPGAKYENQWSITITEEKECMM